MADQRRITASRLGRLGMLGKLAGGIAGGMLSEGARRIGQGQTPSVGDLVLTPANIHRIANSLSQMRGAAMKLAQLISMDSGDLLPPALTEILARLRENAHSMPLGDVDKVLEAEWGADWQRAFRRFAFTPIAAASIGQVHKAELNDGRTLAIKLQYPGIRRSIDSDVDNVATLLNRLRLLPKEIDVGPLLAEAKQQLQVEADYRAEADSLKRFATLLDDDERYRVPAVIDELTTDKVLVMSFERGQPIESLDRARAEVRNRTIEALLELALREVFEWGLVQTDPNFANYLFDPDSGRIQLLDFGATRAFDSERRAALNALLLACRADDPAAIAEAATRVGYLSEDDVPGYREAVTGLLRLVTEPLRCADGYAFGSSGLATQVSETVIRMRLEQRYGHLPPTDILFLHRKLGGLYLLLKRVGVRIDVPRVLERVGQPSVATASPEPVRVAG